jgi:hypothetical protein
MEDGETSAGREAVVDAAACSGGSFSFSFLFFCGVLCILKPLIWGFDVW